MADDEDTQQIAFSDQDETVFVIRVLRIIVLDGAFVEEHGLRFFAGNAVFLLVRSTLAFIPFKVKHPLP